MNVRPGIVTEEQAAFIKARWWKAAKSELVAWVICFPLVTAILFEPLASFHWPPLVYLAIAGASLLLFSRLVIWATILSAVLAHVALGLAGHSNIMTYYILDACIVVVLLRSPLSLFFFLFLASSIRMGAQHAQTVCAQEKPEYDPQFDQYVFRSGRREPAFLNPPKPKEGLFESAEDYHERRDRDFFDKRDKDFFEDHKQHQDRERRVRAEDHFRN
jgi:hypothetical protein